MQLNVPVDWRFEESPGFTVCRRKPFSPCLQEVREALLRSESLFVIGTDGVGLRSSWILATDHISLFGDGPLVGPNDEAAGPRFPSLSGMYLSPGGSWRRGVVLRVPDWRLATMAELGATGADAAVTEGVEEAIGAGHGGARVALLVRCHGPSCWNGTEPPLMELLEKLSRGTDR